MPQGPNKNMRLYTVAGPKSRAIRQCLCDDVDGLCDDVDALCDDVDANDNRRTTTDLRACANVLQFARRTCSRVVQIMFERLAKELAEQTGGDRRSSGKNGKDD